MAVAAGVLLASPAAAQDAAPVIAAERAFATRAAEVGIARSFLDFMADDAIMFAPEPTLARKLYGGRPPEKTPKEGGALLAWWPNLAAIAQSGDLGFTTGPAELNGKRSVNYFTVWKKQPDGTWKWVYDGGASDASQGRPADAPVEVLPPGEPAPVGNVAFTEVRAAEAALAEAARRDLPAAYRAALAPRARLQGSPRPPADTPADQAAELATRARTVTFTPLGGEASAAGDLAWTFGEGRWEGGRGFYARIWRRQADGWRIVFDQLLAAPAPQSTPTS
ncbi:DUF4440 domain-containing protein [Phenylobacterium sp.]|jgi:ketosteroid isomerase-like protein|uniref:DUF4440 domain-containing protein n=1 Tax=Phenylobacterium sp. TaxID=1871053 RepID=UPI0037841175